MKPETVQPLMRAEGAAAGPAATARPDALVVSEGVSHPLGATPDETGVNFVLFSAHATRVELCLFDPTGATELHRIELPEHTDQVFHGRIEGIGPGAVYGYRVHGPYDPENGHRFNHNKLLLDPYARSHVGALKWDAALFGYQVETGDDLTFDERDSAPFVPKCVVVAERPNALPLAPAVPWRDTVIWEGHVKGLTKLHPGVPEPVRGTYAGLGHDALLAHAKELGVTAIELLPIHMFLDDSHLLERGLVNYWGYNSLGFFDPEARYAADPARRHEEFGAMVEAIHRAGLEVILDVVFNHTAEGNERGPTLSFKGIDNRSYYRLMPDEPRYYINDSGTGNTLNLSHGRVVQFVTDSLRHWVTAYGIDGFRFDLGTVLAREFHGFDAQGGFLKAVGQDPILRHRKLVAEPWDVGIGGYQVGAFPPGWAEWNDKFRDTVRDYWRGEALPAALAPRLCGSGDLFNHDGRRPFASVNFVTAHDGFTLRDLVSFNEKHNEANGEENRDGTGDNRSWNCGAEGVTDDPDIRALRLRQMKNLMATLVLSEGTPMLLAGDELGRTQHGNNNAYCQDGEISWIGWTEDAEAGEFSAFTKRLLAIRREYGALRASRFLTGATDEATGARDLAWVMPSGDEFNEDDWSDPDRKAFGMLVDPKGFAGGPGSGPAVLLLLNSEPDDVAFALPRSGEAWRVLVNTAGDLPTDDATFAGGSEWIMRGRSLAFFAATAN